MSRTNFERRQRSHYVEGSECAGTGPTFVIKHKANRMGVGTLKSKEVWYVDFVERASSTLARLTKQAESRIG